MVVAADLPYAAGFFDAVFLGFTLELFTEAEIPVVLGECRRVLWRGGRICVVAVSDRMSAHLMTAVYAWAHRNFPAYVDCRPIRAEKVLRLADLEVLETLEMSMSGIAVDVVTAKRK